MKQILLQLFVVFFLVVTAQAQELSMSDTLSASGNNVPALLKGNNHKAIAAFLNQHYLLNFSKNIKSAATELQLDSIIISKWMGDLQGFEKDKLYSYSVENEGNSAIVSIFSWDVQESKWLITNKNFYDFDKEGRVGMVEFQEYFPGNYKQYTKIVYEYENGLIKYESRYDRIDDIENWSALEQYQYDYNANGSLKAVYQNEWDSYGNDWGTFAFRTYAYDSLGNVVTEVGYDYDYYDMVAKKKFEIRYFYDPQSNLSEWVEYVPGWEEGVFVPERRQLNSYNVLSQLESETFYNWSYDEDGWMAEVKRSYSHNFTGDQIYETASYLWADEKKEWVGSEKLVYESENRYNTANIKDWELLENYMPVYEYQGMVCDKINSSTFKNGEWASSQRTHYYFSDDNIVGVDDQKSKSIAVYPNPLTDQLNINTNDLEETLYTIYDISGKKLEQGSFRNRIKLGTSHLKPGIYILELQQGGFRVSIQKLLKK